jgi:hypothetical protein
MFQKNVMIWVIVLPALLIAFSGTACGSDKSGSKAPAASGKKKLLLFAKTPSNWSIVKGGASGTLDYQESKGVFNLNASGLLPLSSYALVRYSDSTQKGEILARGVSNKQGVLEMHGVWRNWTKKFWVVSGEDVLGNAGEIGSLLAWRPDRYLFEEKPLGVTSDFPKTKKHKY